MEDPITMRRALYDVQWQLLRMDCKGVWGDTRGAGHNLHRMRLYLERGKTLGDSEYTTRLWRVVNLLNAVRMSLGNTHRGSRADMMIQDFRDLVSAERRKYANTPLRTTSADEIVTDWSGVAEAKKEALLNDLNDRLNHAAETSQRNELRWFIDLLETGVDNSEAHGLATGANTGTVT